MKRNITPVFCHSCGYGYHKKCTGLTRDAQDIAAKDGGWTCPKCCSRREKQVPFQKEETSEVSEMELKSTRDSLRVMQWNCDGLNTKIPELKSRLLNDRIDVYLLQEVKLPLTQTYTPVIDGYGVKRFNRTATTDGGLLVYVKRDVVFEVVSAEMKEATEVYTARVKMSKNNWIQLVNVYIPPPNSTGQEIRAALEIVPTSEKTIICGDFNGHSLLWDKHYKEDDRGNLLEMWMIANDLNVLNTGEPTRINRDTGNPSTPDIAFCGKKMVAKSEWKVTEEIGKSDHSPIIITINETLSTQKAKVTRAKWKRKDVAWGEFTEVVESEFAQLGEE